MTATQLHAAILGAAIVLSSGIYFVRRSMAQRDEAGSPVVEPDSPRPDVKTPQAAAADHTRSLDSASSLMKEAREILQAAQRMDNNEAQMLEARKLIDEAQALLELLPSEDPEVQALQREHRVLHLDAVKVSNF